MVSMNVGAGQGARARKCTLTGCVASMVTAVAIISIIVPASGYLTTLFTRQQDVVDIANHALHIYTYSVVGFGICMVVQGAFIGLGRTKIPMVVGLLRIWLLRYLFILVTESFLAYDSVFWGNLFSNYVAAIISMVLVLNIKWKSAIQSQADK